MKLFIFGKNPEISKLELLIVLKSLDLDFKINLSNKNFIIIQFINEAELAELNLYKLINYLGGTIRIANEITEDTFENSIYNHDVFLPKKFNFAFSELYKSQGFRSLENDIQNFFKQNKFKALRKKTQRLVPTPSEYSSWKLSQGAEFFQVANRLFLTEECPDASQFKNADLERPERLFTHGTSPRLARIMTNILNPTKDDTIVDPFCGTGTFLIELIARGVNPIGIDNDPELVNIAKLNVEWAEKKAQSKKISKIIYADSTKADFNATMCVFEPYMGPFLKTAPTNDLAKKITAELLTLYTELFRNLSNNLTKNKKVVCIIPYFISQSNKTFELDNQFFSKNGFRLSEEFSDYGIRIPLVYSTPSGNKIGRKLYILEKI